LILELDLGCDTKEEKKLHHARCSHSLGSFSDTDSHPIHFICLSDMSCGVFIILFKFDQWIRFLIRHDMRRYACSAFQILLHTLPQAETTTNLRNDISVYRFIYLGHTHFDISFAVSVMSHYIHNLRNDHMNVVYQILRYLNSAHEKGLIFRKKWSCKH
jgi:hypothetical protein